MAKNPMQRKAQNSFLLGILITLLITGAIIAFLIFHIISITQKQQKEAKSLKTVYVVSKNIESGETVTEDKLQAKTIDETVIPENALTLSELEEKTNILDNDGNVVRKVSAISKIDLKQGTVITTDMIATSEELASDLRKQEYNMIQLPSQLENNKYVDVRLKLPNGKDFIVISHKKVTIPEIDGVPSLNTISLNVSETEILTLSCAIVECYKIEGSNLYVNEYIEPGLQIAATPTYIPDDETINLINRDPNCVQEAKQALFQRNNNSDVKGAVRNPINKGLNENSEQATENASNGIKQEIQRAQEERQKYLESLGGNY